MTTYPNTRIKPRDMQLADVITCTPGRAWGAQEVEAWRDSHDDGTLMPDWTRGTYCSDLPGTPGETLHDMFQALIDLEAERVWNEARRIYDVDRDGN